MKLSDSSIQALEKLITGNQLNNGEQLANYRSGPALVEFFNQFGFNEVYPQSGFPSRWEYTQEKMREVNETPSMREVVAAALDPRNFFDTRFDVGNAISYINKYLNYDGYEVCLENASIKVKDLSTSAINLEVKGDLEIHDFITEQIQKSEEKILNGDYDGAITNARSLLEAVMQDIERQLSSDFPAKYDGDMVKLYGRVKSLLKLDPKRTDINKSLTELLSGLFTIVKSLSSLRNCMSDAHARSYKPAKHHAVFIVNSAKTMANFLYDTAIYQGLITDDLVVSHQDVDDTDF